MTIRCNGKLSSCISLAQPLASEPRKHVVDINQDVILCARSWGCILIHPGPGSSSHLHNNLVGCLRLILTQRSLTRDGPPNSDVCQRVADVPHQRQLRYRAIFWCTTGTLFMHHAESKKLTIWETARVRVRPHV